MMPGWSGLPDRPGLQPALGCVFIRLWPLRGEGCLLVFPAPRLPLEPFSEQNISLIGICLAGWRGAELCS